MEVKDAINKLLSNDSEIVNLVKGQFGKWEGWVKGKLGELDSWKNNYENAGIGLKKYKGLIGSRGDFLKAVVPLVELTDGNGSRKSAFSYTEGRFSLVRSNGCCIQSPVMIDIKAIKKYNLENMDLYKINLDTDHVKPCKFIYKGKLWGGLHIYDVVQSHYLLFNGWSNCEELVYIPYEDVRGTDNGGQGVINSEVKNSLEILEA